MTQILKDSIKIEYKLDQVTPISKYEMNAYNVPFAGNTSMCREVFVKGERKLEFSIDGDMSLSQIMQKPVFRDELVEYIFSISKQLVSVIQNGLALEKVVWDTNYMYVRFSDFSIQLLYLPFESKFDKKDIGEFVLERADSIMKSMVSDIGQEEKIGYYTKTLNIIKKEILKSSGEKVTLKKRYIRFISNIAHAFNIETHDMPKDDSAIFEACIWKDKLTEIYRHFFISLSQINTNDELVSTRSNNFESMTKQFTEEIAKIKSALKLKKDFNLVNKYSGKKQGCYTIFVLPNGEKYWALSGTDSWDRNKRLQMEMLVKYIFDNTFGWHHVTNIYTKNHGIRYCPIRKKTMRYTEVIEPDSNSKIKYVDKKEKLGDDLKTRRIDKRKDDYLRKIGLTYGCCERKIMSYLSDFNGITIYSRWAPCEKCMPAIFELGKYTYYAYAKNYMEWINGGKPMKLEKYTVEKSYLVSIE